jgi:hypothetical protein
MDGMSDQSRLVIKDLSDFGQKTAGVGGSASASSNSTMSDFSSGLASPTGMVVKGEVAGAALGTNESQTFNDWYSQGVCDPTTQFAGDAPKGITALGFGAVVMAGNYADGDASQATLMNDVMNMFSQDPSKGLDADMATNNQGIADKTKVKTKQAPDTPDDAPPVCRATGPLTPMEQLNNHNNEYGQWETWTPPDPNAPVDPVDVEPLGPGMI